MPHSHHSHSGQFCRHAKDTLEQVVLEAIRQGFEVFGLSEHAPRYRFEDLFPEEADLTPQNLVRIYEEFLETAQKLRQLYVNQIQLLIGLETDFITTLDSNGISTTLQHHISDIDYIVGSVHHVNGVSIDFDRQTWLRAVQNSSNPIPGITMIPPTTGQLSTPFPIDPSDKKLHIDYSPTLSELKPFLLSYFDSQYDLFQRHQPEVIGHFDLCLLWTPEMDLKSEELEGVWEKVERNTRYVIEYGGLFEANAAAFRKGWDTSYPSRQILDFIISLNGRICLSDDSHGVSYVGLNYLKLRDYLLEAGVSKIWYLVRSSNRRTGDSDIGSRGRVVARQLEGEWGKHPFWEKLTIAQASP